MLYHREQWRAVPPLGEAGVPLARQRWSLRYNPGTMSAVGIIGGAGFIGSFVTRAFLEQGHAVRASVTDIGQRDRFAHLEALDGADRLEVVPLNAMDPEGVRGFLRGCDIVIHAGTPFQLAVADTERDMMAPTVKGTETFLAEAGRTPGLARMVMVASVAAFNTDFPMPVPGRAVDHVYSEADPPYHSPESIPYARAKYYADQAVRRWVQEHPDPGLEVVTVCPTFVVGPALSRRQDSTSQAFQFLAKQRLAPDDFFAMLWQADVEWALVDVLDVAEAINRAATTPGLHGRSYLVSGDSWRMSDIHRLLNQQEPERAPRTVYSSASASADLGVSPSSARVPLARYAALAGGTAPSA